MLPQITSSGLQKRMSENSFRAGGQPRQLAVVARVDAVADEVAVVEGAEHAVREGELRRLRLAAREVEAEFEAAEGFVLRAGAGKLRFLRRLC